MKNMFIKKYEKIVFHYIIQSRIVHKKKKTAKLIIFQAMKYMDISYFVQRYKFKIDRKN